MLFLIIITNNQSNTVSVIRLKDLAKIGYTTVDEAPYGIDYSNSSNSIYVANTHSGTITILDENTHDIKKRILLRPGIETLKISQDGRKAVVLNQYEDRAYIIDTETDTLNGTVNTGEAPDYVFFLDDYVLIHNAYSNYVTYINMNNTQISNQAQVGNQPPLDGKPHSIAVSCYGNEAVITSPRDTRYISCIRCTASPWSWVQQPQIRFRCCSHRRKQTP